MQNESPSMAMAYLANLAKFDPQEDSFSRFSQKSHSHPSEIKSEQTASRLILESSQSGNDLEPANQAFPILVECWTPFGIRRVVEANSAEHADWIRQMNPKPQQVRCVDCHHATLNGGVAKCGVGVDSGLATGGFWYTDVHFCGEFVEILNDEPASVTCRGCRHAEIGLRPPVVTCGLGLQATNPAGWLADESHPCGGFESLSP